MRKNRFSDDRFLSILTEAGANPVARTRKERSVEQTGSPMLESFHSRFRGEQIDRTRFDSGPDAIDLLSRSERYYNQIRFQSEIPCLTPAELHVRRLSPRPPVAQ